MGSSVPQWPTFLICNRRLTSATTSCEVMPAALSTNSTPSGVALNDITNFLQHTLLRFRERSANACARGEFVPAATKFLGNRTHISGITFGAHTYPHFSFWEFFEENGDDYAFD